MKKIVFQFIFFSLFLSAIGYGQTTIYTQDFEILNDGYTASAAGGSGSTDVFNRVNPSIGGNNTFIWAAEDMDNASGVSGNETIILDQIDVTGYGDFTFSIDFLTPNTNDWDVASEVLITYSLDGGPSQNLLWVQNQGSTFNDPASIDTDFDGDGEVGEELPALVDDEPAGVGSNFENFSSNQIFLSGNSTLDITITFNDLTQNDVGLYMDNIEVIGTAPCTGQPSLQASNITFSNESLNSIDVSWTAGTGGDEHILVARKGTDVSFTPTDGTDYSTDAASGDFSNAINQTAGNKVVYTGSATSTSITGLCDNTTYYFQVFHYCSNSSFDYLTSSGTNNDGSQNTSTNAVGNNIYTQDFEVLNDGYTASATGGSGSTDVFNRVNPNIGGNNTFIWAAEDTDSVTGGSPTLTLDQIDVTGLSDFTFSIDLLTPNTNDWDGPDEVLITYSLDGGVSQNLLLIRNTGGGTNEPAAIDRDNDGNGDIGEELPAIDDDEPAGVGSNFENFSSDQISLSSNSTLDITVEYISLTQNDTGLYIDNIEVSSTSAVSSIDEDSSISDVMSQPASGTIASTVDLYSNAVTVFEFQVSDSASSDTDDTEISQFRLIPGPDNTANWQDVIQGIRIESSNSNSVLEVSKSQFVSKTNDEIVIEILDNTDGEMTIASGTTVTFTIKVFLEESGIIDNEIIQFAMPTDSTDWLVPISGSSLFECSFTAFNGNTFTIEVDGDGLDFISDASDTNINEAMTTIEVANTDANGNVDRDLTDDVEITSTGTLTGDPVTITPVDGVASFSSLTHTAIGTGLTLTASTTAAGVMDATSSTFDIREVPELMISEIADPADHLNPNSSRYIELYNTGTTTIDFNSDTYYIHNESIGSIQLTGSLPANSYYIIALDASGFNAEYGFDADLISNIVNFNGNDVVYLSTGDSQSSLFDIYGVIANNNSSSQPWDYTNTRVYRDIPTVSQPKSTYIDSEWTIASSPSDGIDMTPGVKENDYIYSNDADTWTKEGNGGDPDGVIATTQNILVKSGTATLNDATSVNRIIVADGATLIIEDLLTIDGDFISEGTTIFRSNATTTAALAEVPTNSRIRGNGFQIERFVPATSRSFRYISPSVDTQNSTNPTIYDNWQEGGSSAGSYGTHITGSTIGANGLDQTSSGSPSLYQWNEGTQVWEAITSTNQPSDVLAAGDAYAMLIRGDRTTTLNSDTALGPPTTLRTTGQIVTGDIAIGTDVGELAQNQGEFSLIGNPYQAQVDLELLLKNHNTDLSGQFAYIYDPNITSIGGYVTIDLGTGAANGITTSTPNTSDANRFLQPNQAFFVETTASSPTPALTFVESIKSTNVTNVDTFSEDDTEESPQFIIINLYDDDEQTIKDGVRVKFDSKYSNLVNEKDAPKFWNDFEWFSLVNNNNYMSIESRAIPQQAEIVSLYTGNYQSSNYHFSIDIQNMDYANIQLYDNYLGIYTDLSSGVNTIPFTVDNSIPNSVAGNRFELFFDSVNLSNDDFKRNKIKIYPNPVQNQQLTISGLTEFSQNQEVNIRIYNLLGQEIYRQKLNVTSQQETIKFSKLPVGSYFLNLTSNQQSHTIPFIVK